MTTRKLDQKTKLVELDFIDFELVVEINPGDAFEIDHEDSGCVSVEIDGDKVSVRPDSQADEFEMAITVPPETGFMIRCLNGNVSIDNPWKGSIAVECLNELEFGCAETGSVAIKCESGSIEIASARDIAIKTTSSDISIGDCQDNLAIESISSDVELDFGKTVAIKTVQGDTEIGHADILSVQTLSGDLSVDEAGDVDIDCTSGDIEIGSVKGKLRIRSISSEIAIAELTTDDAQINDVSGSISIDSLLACEGKVEIKTVADDVHVGVHPDSSATFTLKSAAGEITTPNEDESEIYAVGSGKAIVCITSVSGSIEIE